MTGLSKEETDSIKKSYLNIVALFLSREKVDSKYLKCLLKWGFELHLGPDDLRDAITNIEGLTFSRPDDKIALVESIYHLVHMICLDQVVEDIELEIASIYAENLGFDRSLVSELFKAIVTADSDGVTQGDVRQQVIDFIKLNQP